MYPPVYTLITDNVRYDEPEDEFDIVVPDLERERQEALEIKELFIDVVNDDSPCPTLGHEWDWLVSTPIVETNVPNIDEEQQSFTGSIFRSKDSSSLRSPRAEKLQKVE